MIDQAAMSPPPSIPLAAENEYWTDEGIFMSLLNFNNGKPLPSNVEFEVNPYQYRPQDLPADLWYLCSGVKKEAECGFWVETGEPIEIFSNSAVHGFRTTLRFYEGRDPHGRKTDWVMQEYRITEKGKDNLKDHRALCRVFMAVEDSPEMDCILTGDYFELNDLIDDDPPSRSSSSSANSSCLTMTSDECFDSMALLKQLDDDQNMKDSTVNFNLSAPVNSKIFICPVSSVSLKNETSEAKEVAMNESSSNGADARIESSSSSEGILKEGKEGGRIRKKRKMMKYLCFLAF